MNYIMKIIISIILYQYFEYFHLYNYEIILVGKILYINTKLKNTRLVDQIV